MHKMLLDKIDYNSHKEHITDILDMLMCDAKDKNHELYNHIEDEMYEMVHGKNVNEEMAKKWVHNMRPAGEHWDIEETTNAMHNLGYSHNIVDFYIVANMCFNDYYDLVKEDEVLALKLAHDWLDDEDAKDCKLYQYWRHIIKKD